VTSRTFPCASHAELQHISTLWIATWTGARITFEGLLQTSNADQQAAQHRAYLQLYRTGLVETLDSTVTARKLGNAYHLDARRKLIFEVMRILRDLVGVGIDLPMLCSSV